MSTLIKTTIKSFTVILVLFCILLAQTQVVFAANKSVTDEVNLFNTSELSTLTSLIAEVKAEYDIDIYILTRSSIIGTKQRYMDTYVASNSSDIKDAVLLLINMDSNDRGVQIQGYGTCATMVNNTRIESILNKIVPTLSNANYYNAMTEFIVEVEKYVKKGEPSKFAIAIENIPHSQNLFFAMVISTIIVGVLIYKSEGRNTTNYATYSQNPNVLGRQDRYTHTTTTRVQKPQNNGGGSNGGGGSGGGGGGGRSSGGASF